ncbi:MAG: uL15 family ribosomal protein [Candidatus Peribacteria bacterium]|nr:uL15 family ribosomal protein [Candidatus Peribacteria bacterium]
MFRRTPKLKGFSNAVFKKEYNIITFRDLELLAKAGIVDINKEVLLEKKVI